MHVVLSVNTVKLAIVFECYVLIFQNKRRIGYDMNTAK